MTSLLKILKPPLITLFLMIKFGCYLICYWLLSATSPVLNRSCLKFFSWGWWEGMEGGNLKKRTRLSRKRELVLSRPVRRLRVGYFNIHQHQLIF